MLRARGFQCALRRQKLRFQRRKLHIQLLALRAQHVEPSAVAAVARFDALQFRVDGRQICLHRIAQGRGLFFFFRPAEHLVLRLTELLPHGRQFKLRLRRARRRLAQLLLQRFKLLGLFGAFALQSCQIVRAGEHARALRGRAAGHAAARVHHLSVERHDAEAVLAGTCHADGVVERLGDDRPPEQILEDLFIFRRGLHQRRGDAHEAGLPLESVQAHAFAPDRIHREERGPAAVAPLEHLDGRLAAVFIFHDDVLHRRAKGRLDGGRKFVVHADQLRHRAAHAAQVSALSVLHHEAHRLGKALKFPLHLAQHLHPRLDGLELDARRVRLLLQLRALVLPGLEPQLIAGDRIVRGGHVLLRLRQPLAALGLPCVDVCAARFGGGAVFLQNVLPFQDFTKRRRQRCDLRVLLGGIRL